MTGLLGARGGRKGSDGEEDEETHTRTEKRQCLGRLWSSPITANEILSMSLKAVCLEGIRLVLFVKWALLGAWLNFLCACVFMCLRTHDCLALINHRG